MATGESWWLFCWVALRVALTAGKAVELRSNGQPRAAVPTFICLFVFWVYIFLQRGGKHYGECD